MVDVVCGPLRFSSRFDSGNLDGVFSDDPLDRLQVQRAATELSPTSPTPASPQQFYLSVAQDCKGTSHENKHRSWFYFSVTYVGPPQLPTTAPQSPCTSISVSQRRSFSGTHVTGSVRKASGGAASFRATFTVFNFSAANRMFDHDNRPVYRTDEQTEWERLPQPLVIAYYDRHGNPMAAPPPSAAIADALLPGSSASLVATAGGFNASPSASSSSFFSAGSASNFARASGTVVPPSAKALASGTMRITWSYNFTRDDETVWFAMCYPYSYTHQLATLDRWQAAFAWDQLPPATRAKYLAAVASAGGTPTTGEREGDSDRADTSEAPLAPPSAPLAALSQPAGRRVVGACGSGGRSVCGSIRTERAPGCLRIPAPPPTASWSAKKHSTTAAAAAAEPPSSPSSTTSASPSPTTATVADAVPVYFQRETLCYSIENRRVDLLTISGVNGMGPDSDREPYHTGTIPVRSHGVERPHAFPDKQIVLLTARVHPGEVPASHVLHGIIEFLLNATDPRAAVLRSRFVFKIVPMLNPDGVAMGHYRTDRRGVNLNRMYSAPDISTHPTINAARTLFLALADTGRLAMYVDMHAHASKRGCFVFGNAWDDASTTIQNMLFPKLISLNTMHFAFTSCDFTSRSMMSKNRAEGSTKEGTGRVALASETGLVHSYTLEVSYNMSLSLNPIAPLDLPGEQAFGSSRSRLFGGGGGASASSSGGKYSPATYHEVGRGLLVAILDLHSCNPLSRLPLTPYVSLAGVRHWLERQVKQLHSEQQRASIESCYSSNKATKRHKVRLLERAAGSLALPSMNGFASGGVGGSSLSPLQFTGARRGPSGALQE